MADFASFSFTTQETWYGEISFLNGDADNAPLSLAGRSFEMLVTPAGRGGSLLEPVRTLTMQFGGGLSFKAGGTDTLLFRVDRDIARRDFARIEYTADILEVVDGERHLFMPVRVRYSEPSGLTSFVPRLVGVSVTFSARRQPIITPVAITGRQGQRGAGVLSGSRLPADADGIDGDFWLDVSDSPRVLYGPKAGGAWPTVGEAITSTITPEMRALRNETIAARDTAGQNALTTAGDRDQTGRDRTQTGLDRSATSGDRTQTGQDRQQTSADRTQTGQDRTQTGQDRAATESARSQAQAAVASGRVSRPTKGDLDSVVATYSDGAVGVAEAGAGAGEYVRRNAMWVYTGPTAAFLNSLTLLIKGYLDASFTRASGLYKSPSLQAVMPWFADSAGKVLLGFDRRTEQVVGALFGLRGMYRALTATLGSLRVSPPGQIVPWHTDSAGKVLLGFDRSKETIVGAFPTAGGTELTYLPADPLAAGDYAGSVGIRALMTYGQSLSLGAQSIPPLSTSQPYANLTFAAGPRSTKAGSVGNNPGLDALAPLTENTLTGEGGSNRGETPCSGIANGFVQLALASAGTAPADNVVLSSAAGHGGYTLSQLAKGSAWYQLLIDQVTAGKDLAGAQTKTYEVTAVPWAQGETDAINGLSRAAYAAGLVQLQRDIQADIQAITGQTSPVWLIIAQQGHLNATAAGAAISLAQLDACAQNDRIVLGAPLYHLPRASDALHLTNVGSRWLGACYGKAVHAIVTQRRRPKWVRPLVVTSTGPIIRIAFEVPVAPLRLDTISLAATRNMGFAASDGTGALIITDVKIADGRYVDLTCSRPVSGAPTVRYGLDHLGAGLTIDQGASGNLRDSDPASVTLGGTAIPLFNLCPAFSMAGTNLG